MAGRTPDLLVDVRRHKVALSQPGAAVPDGEGGFTQGEAPLAPAFWWCSIRAATALDMQRIVAGTPQATATHLLRGQYHPGITIDTKITRADGRIYQVQSVQNDDERNIALTLVCAEVLSSGVAQRTDDRGTAGVARGAPAVAAGALE
jgi:head-tail adaptor